MSRFSKRKVSKRRCQWWRITRREARANRADPSVASSSLLRGNTGSRLRSYCPVIDADGHVLEKEKYIRKYLEAPWDKRSTSLRTRDQPWDANLFDSFEMAVRWEDLSPKEQIDEWHAVMEREGMVHAICFPTGSGNVSKIQELDFALSVARACNTHFAKEFNALSDRVSCVGVLPLRDPQAAAVELRRGVTELGLKGFEILPMGLPMALGSTFYDPVYAEAEKVGRGDRDSRLA